MLQIRGGRVKLGFEARESVVIHREEVWDGIRANDWLGRPDDGCATSKEELDRWEDDGGCGRSAEQFRTVGREMKA